jgi:hypothetical protein
MYRIMSVKRGDAAEGDEKKSREVKWEELCWVESELERRFGWGVVDGTTVYTHDEKPSHKSMVLGESS